LAHVAKSVYYDRDLEKEKKDMEKEKRKNKQQEALTAALLDVPSGMIQTHRHVFNVDRKAILRGSAPEGNHLWDPAPSAGEIIGRHTVLGSLGNRGQSLLCNYGS
jgi:hypothetical protein